MSESDTTALEVIPKESALAVLTNPEKFDEFFERVAKEVRGVEPDLTTAAGRKAVAALAFKVTKSKTAIVAAADLLTEDARAQIKKVNESKKEIETRLDDLKREVRKPLTDWEEAEEARQEMVQAKLAEWKEAGAITLDDTSATTAARLAALQGSDIDLSQFGDHLSIAQAVIGTAVANLRTATERLRQAEADAAELATLRAQTAERDAADAKRREEEAAAEEARKAEAQRRQDEEDQRERDRIAAEEAKEAARVAEEQRIENERIAEEQRVERERLIAEQAAAAERTRIAVAAATQKAADEKRAANVKHQGKIMGEAKVAIMKILDANPVDGNYEVEYSERVAKAVVSAIVKGDVPHIAITF
jgi:colicin import membrane protein